MFMLTRIAMADAYGAGFEFAQFDVPTENTFEGYRLHNMEGTPAGNYTDDTQMSLAVARVLLTKDEPSARDFAEGFYKTFKDDPRVTYARRFHEFLSSCISVEQFISDIKPDSKRSGAAMRGGPVGLYGSIDKVLRLAERHARVTHNTDEGVATAQVVAAAVHYNAFVRGTADAPALFDFLNEKVPGYAWETPWIGRVSVDGLPCTRAALTAYSNNNSYAAMVQEAVDFTGDTDTVAAIAAAIASVDSTYALDHPRWMETDLEDGFFGKSYLLAFDEGLANLYKRELANYNK